MSDITDWEPEMITAIDWEAQYERQLRINEILMLEKQEVARQSLEVIKTNSRLKSDYDAYKKSSEQEFRILKAEIITSLRAINLCLIASITTEKQCLTHRSRNFMMRHVNQIISNEVDRFGDRQLTSYEDDF